MSGERYLLCRAADYLLAIRTATIVHIWAIDAASPLAFQEARRIDLCRRLGGDNVGGTALGMQMPGPPAILLVDKIAGLMHLADMDFIALPPVFAFACGMFDAAGRHPVDGHHPLRLRQDLDIPADQALSAPL